MIRVLYYIKYAIFDLLALIFGCHFSKIKYRFDQLKDIFADRKVWFELVFNKIMNLYATIGINVLPINLLLEKVMPNI